MTSESIILARQAKQKAVIVDHLQKVPIVQAVCEKLGISRTTFYRWKSSDKVFRKNVDDSLSQGYGLINDLAESKIINHIKEGNLRASFFWLRIHNKIYRDKLEIIPSKERDETLTPEEERHVEEALKLAKLACNPQIDGSENDS